MLKKFIIIVFHIFCYIALLSCVDASAKEGDNISVTPNPDNQTNLENRKNAKDNTNKTTLEFMNYCKTYNGYLDRLAMYGNRFDNQDYDADGLNDRVYRSVFRVIKESKYGNYTELNTRFRIDFGNGSTLEIGDFEDVCLGIYLIGSDLTSDGINEIIFVGRHEASTIPDSSGESGIYHKTEIGYELMPLPRPDDWNMNNKYEKYNFGYSAYKTSVKDNKVTIYSPMLDYKHTLIIDDKNEEAISYFNQYPYNDTITGPVHWINVTEYNNKRTIVLYNHIGSKYTDIDIAVYMNWQDGKFKPVKAEVVPTYRNLTIQEFY
jgi:hypothetical protein